MLPIKEINVTDLSGISDVLIELENSNHTMTYVNGNTWEINNLTPSTVDTLSLIIYANDSLGNWNLISDTIIVNMQISNGNTGLSEEFLDSLVIFSTFGVLGVLAVVLANSLRPKRFLK